MKHSLKLGADPEFFLAYRKDNVPYVLSPALMMEDMGLKRIGGTSKHPIFIDRPEYHWMMDGVAFEITLLHPHDHPLEMWSTIRTALDDLNETLTNVPHPELGPLELYTLPTISIEPNLYLPRMDSETIFQGFIFGCDPDNDAIDTDYVCQTADVSTHPYRYGGGHLHISGDDMIAEYPAPMIRLLAITVGNYCISQSPVPELERLRTQTYGRPGRYRYQTYKNGTCGVEYRTPSNTWASFTAEQIEGMYDMVDLAVDLLHNERFDVVEDLLPSTIDSIVNANVQSANNVLEQLRGYNA